MQQMTHSLHALIVVMEEDYPGIFQTFDIEITSNLPGCSVQKRLLIFCSLESIIILSFPTFYNCKSLITILCNYLWKHPFSLAFLHYPTNVSYPISYKFLHGRLVPCCGCDEGWIAQPSPMLTSFSYFKKNSLNISYYQFYAHCKLRIIFPLFTNVSLHPCQLLELCSLVTRLTSVHSHYVLSVSATSLAPLTGTKSRPSIKHILPYFATNIPFPPEGIVLSPRSPCSSQLC